MNKNVPATVVACAAVVAVVGVLSRGDVSGAVLSTMSLVEGPMFYKD